MAQTYMPKDTENLRPDRQARSRRPSNRGDEEAQPPASCPIVVKRRRGFVSIPNDVTENPNTSWQAKGLLSYLLSKPDGWVFRVSDICKRGKGGRAQVYSCLRELRAEGYAAYKRKPMDGHPGLYHLTLMVSDTVGEVGPDEAPQRKVRDVDYRHVDTRDVDKRHSENRHLSKTEGSKTEGSKTETDALNATPAASPLKLAIARCAPSSAPAASNTTLEDDDEAESALQRSLDAYNLSEDQERLMAEDAAGRPLGQTDAEAIEVAVAAVTLPAFPPMEERDMDDIRVVMDTFLSEKKRMAGELFTQGIDRDIMPPALLCLGWRYFSEYFLGQAALPNTRDCQQALNATWSISAQGLQALLWVFRARAGEGGHMPACVKHGMYLGSFCTNFDAIEKELRRSDTCWVALSH